MSILNLILKKNKKLRWIKTARTIEEMNIAVRGGFRVLVKEAETAPKFPFGSCVVQLKDTGEIKLRGNHPRVRDRFERDHPNGYDILIPSYYPQKFEYPFAAYLIPPDIKMGEIVLLEDLIEDINYKGYRLPFSEAEWTGEDFKILFDANKDIGTIVG